MNAAEQEIRDLKNALSAVMLAAAFVIEPGTWPAFAAFIERNTGKDFASGPEDMSRAIQITDDVRGGLMLMLGQDPGETWTDVTR